MVQGKYAEQIGDVLRRDFGVLTVSVQAKKGLATKKDRRAFSSALEQVSCCELCRIVLWAS